MVTRITPHEVSGDERFRMLLERIPNVAVQAFTEDGTIQYWNKASEAIYGYTEAEAIGKTIYDCIIPGDAEVMVKEAIAAAIRENREISAGELQLRHKNGHYVSVYSSHVVIRVPGEAPQFFCIDLDMKALQTAESECKRMKEALAESEARYHAIIEQAPEAVVICDPVSGELLEANKRFTEISGYELNRDGPLNLYDLIADSRSGIQAYQDELKTTGGLAMQRRVGKHRDGRWLAFERSARVIRYQGRTVIAAMIRDVSAEVRREQETVNDAQLAQRIQNAMLSKPETSKHLEVDTIFQPLGHIGGDLYFLDWRYGGNLLRGFLVDATGHGLSTALHTASLHVLLREVNELDLPIAEAMRWLNRRACLYFDEGTFAGGVGFEFDLETRRLRWVCAGIPRMWMATKLEGGLVAKQGLFLGLKPEEIFETNEMDIGVGDSFYFMTDGLSDLFESQTVLQLQRYPDMVEKLRVLSESKNRRDDATAVCIHVKSLPLSPLSCDGWPRSLHINGYGDYQRLKNEVARIVAELTGLPHSLQEVAVNEALANAMECRDGVGRQHKARLRFNKIGKRVVIRVRTSRLGFAGNAILRRLRSQPEDMFSFGEDASMGRGIPMMLTMSHKMTYNSEGTEVLLAWRL